MKTRGTRHTRETGTTVGGNVRIWDQPDRYTNYKKQQDQKTRLHNPRNCCKWSHELVQQPSRRAIKGEDSCLFSILVQLINNLSST